MSNPPPPQPPSAGLVRDLIAAVFAYADKPWKWAVLIVAALLVFLGWIFYERRNELFEVWMTPTEPTLLESEIPAALDELARDTDADILQLWSIDLGRNLQKFKGARRHDGAAPVIPNPRELPIFEKESIRQDIRGVINVIEGHPTCQKLSSGGTPIVRRLQARGMDHGCAIPIPPGPDALVGIIYLAWAHPICTDGPDGCAGDMVTENVAVTVAREVAKKLSTH